MAEEINKEVVQESVIDEKALETLAAKVVEKVAPQLSEKVLAQLAEVEKKIEKKQIEAEKGGEFEATKHLSFMRACIGLVSGKKEVVTAYNEKALEARRKAGYNNTATDADGGYIVMDPEFEAEIEKIAPAYGVALTEANVRVTDRETIKTNKRGNNVTMYEITEAGAKTVSKLTISQVEVSLREFAGIAVATDKLIEDAAIDFWQDVIEGFAEEMARWADVLVFTDRTASKQGVLHIAGTKAIAVGAAITSLTWDHLLDAEVSVPTNAMKNGKFYMHRSVWNIVRKCKDSELRYMWLPQMGLQTPWGTPVVLVDAMPTSTDVGDANEPYVVFGDLKRIRLYRKRGLEFLQSQHATITDADSVSQNLYMQDMTALRATVRMVALHKFPEAFCIIGTGTVS